MISGNDYCNAGYLISLYCADEQDNEIPMEVDEQPPPEDQAPGSLIVEFDSTDV